MTDWLNSKHAPSWWSILCFWYHVLQSWHHARCIKGKFSQHHSKFLTSGKIFCAWPSCRSDTQSIPNILPHEMGITYPITRVFPSISVFWCFSVADNRNSFKNWLPKEGNSFDIFHIPELSQYIYPKLKLNWMDQRRG